jgi:hypothetical protein
MALLVFWAVSAAGLAALGFWVGYVYAEYRQELREDAEGDWPC